MLYKITDTRGREISINPDYVSSLYTMPDYEDETTNVTGIITTTGGDHNVPNPQSEVRDILNGETP